MSRCKIKEFREVKVGLIIHWSYGGGSELFEIDDLQKIVDLGKEYPVVVEIDDYTKALVKDESEVDFLDDLDTLYSYGMTKQDYLDDDYEYGDDFYEDKIAYIITSDNIINI